MISQAKKYKAELLAIKHEVNRALRTLGDKQLWNITQTDSLRLTKLKLWSLRYGVSINYILAKLLEYHVARLPKYAKDRANQSRGLGIRIATLTGNVSEKHLKDCIFQGYPDGENLVALKESERDRIIDLLDEELPSKPKGVLAHQSINSFVEGYTAKMNRRKKESLAVERQMLKMHWRGNPWL